MISVTPAAAQQINHSIEVSAAQDLGLRIAVHRMQDGSFNYAMGFDEVRTGSDLTVNSEGVTLIYSRDETALLQGMQIDFVELDDGEKNFVFLNPNDPGYQPPQEPV